MAQISMRVPLADTKGVRDIPQNVEGLYNAALVDRTFQDESIDPEKIIGGIPGGGIPGASSHFILGLTIIDESGDITITYDVLFNDTGYNLTFFTSNGGGQYELEFDEGIFDNAYTYVSLGNDQNVNSAAYVYAGEGNLIRIDGILSDVFNSVLIVALYPIVV